jgi:hypothetical protein
MKTPMENDAGKHRNSSINSRMNKPYYSPVKKAILWPKILLSEKA